MERPQSTAPGRFALQQNYPNPFNPVTTIRLTIADRQLTTVRVYDPLGREVAVLMNEVRESGTYTIAFDASGLASGVYVCRLSAGSAVQARSMLLLR